MPRVLSIFLVIAVIVALAGCGSDSATDSTSAGGPETTTETASQTTTEVPVPNKPPIAPKGPPPKNLVIKEVKAGSGPGLKKEDKFIINYRAFDYETGRVVETKWGETAFAWILGIEELVPALEKGLLGMKKGGVRELLAPSKMIYGAEPRIYVVERFA